MTKITFEIEIITPMFLSGADQSKAELRAASIKGLLRFWWRALQAESDMDELRKKEAKIFGSSDEKVGAAKFSLRLVTTVPVTNKFSPVPHSTTKRFQFTGIVPGHKCKILLTSKNDTDEFGNILEIALLLGGLGRRSRRGFGSVHCNQWHFKNKQELQDAIFNKIIRINEDFSSQSGKITRKAGLNASYPFIKEISFGQKEEANVNSLLRKIGQASHNHFDPALGFAGRHNNNTIRMASPVYAHIAKVENGFIPVITTLNSAFPVSYPSRNMIEQTDFIDNIISKGLNYGQ